MTQRASVWSRRSSGASSIAEWRTPESSSPKPLTLRKFEKPARMLVFIGSARKVGESSMMISPIARRWDRRRPARALVGPVVERAHDASTRSRVAVDIRCRRPFATFEAVATDTLEAAATSARVTRPLRAFVESSKPNRTPAS